MHPPRQILLSLVYDNRGSCLGLYEKKLMQGTDQASANHLPQIKSMIEAIQQNSPDLLFDFFAELDQAFGTIYGTYVDELQYLAADEPQNDVAEKIGSCFAEIRPLISALHDDLSLGELSHALETLEALDEETQSLHPLFQEYHRVGQSGPRLSEVPYTHELLRVCHHYLDGKLSVEAVQGRLESFCQYHENLETQVSILVPSPPEREAFESRAEELEEALALQLQGIEDLDFALEQNDKQVLKEALGILQESADVLLDIYHHLRNADLQPRTISCIRCSAENSLDSRICGECGAVLLRSDTTDVTSTVALEEDGSSVGSQDPEEIVLLQQAVDKLQRTGDSNEFLKYLEQYEKRLARSTRQFESLAAPPPGAPPEHLELLEQAQAYFAQALEELKSGLEQLSDGAVGPQNQLLESGMRAVRAGGDLFAQFQQEFNRAQEVQDKSS